MWMGSFLGGVGISHTADRDTINEKGMQLLSCAISLSTFIRVQKTVLSLISASTRRPHTSKRVDISCTYLI